MLRDRAEINPISLISHNLMLCLRDDGVLHGGEKEESLYVKKIFGL